MLDGGRPSGQGEGLLGVDCGNQGVSGEGGEVAKQGSEAVDREAVLGSASGLLGKAAGERSALATTLERCASAASLSVSS